MGRTISFDFVSRKMKLRVSFAIATLSQQADMLKASKLQRRYFNVVFIGLIFLGMCRLMSHLAMSANERAT